MMLAAPVLADVGGIPNGNAWREPGVVALADDQAIGICGSDLPGFSEIGCVMVSIEPPRPGLRFAAKFLHGPELPP